MAKRLREFFFEGVGQLAAFIVDDWEALEGEKVKQQSKWLLFAKWWYNTNHHYASKMTPFQAVYGIPPLRLVEYIPDTALNAAMDDCMKSREEVQETLHHNLLDAPDRMKFHANKRRTERSFEPGDYVYKLLPRFFHPFKVLHKIGQVAYKLVLPTSSQIHPIFFVSCLKKCLDQRVLPLPSLLPVDDTGAIQPKPERVTERRIQKQGMKALTELLVH
ncbi:uncharacterized protein LOC121247499 [Juglans microcarpa x Juglans regia]|uniref:uncharacterized protein LOC121247499 n=1 Tax=Juglans microcarpa x Juglans regia TaxID=2249226 RepID=UPI001B7EB860|nr:uncharacterized protein LOC121247499 [Juglans microcarpa x Juglans regia]